MAAVHDFYTDSSEHSVRAMVARARGFSRRDPDTGTFGTMVRNTVRFTR